MSRTAQQTDEEWLTEWQDYAADVIEAIQDGNLDAHLKDIIKEAVTRVKEAGLVPKEMVEHKDKAPDKDAHGNTLVYVNDAKGNKYPLLENAIIPVPNADPGNKDFFEYDGRVYKRRDFIGHAVRVLPNVNHSWRGKVVIVTGVGPQKVKVRPCEADANGNMTLPIAGEEGYMPKAHLANYFGRIKEA